MFCFRGATWRPANHHGRKAFCRESGCHRSSFSGCYQQWYPELFVRVLNFFCETYEKKFNQLTFQRCHSLKPRDDLDMYASRSVGRISCAGSIDSERSKCSISYGPGWALYKSKGMFWYCPFPLSFINWGASDWKWFIIQLNSVASFSFRKTRKQSYRPPGRFSSAGAAGPAPIARGTTLSLKSWGQSLRSTARWSCSGSCSTLQGARMDASCWRRTSSSLPMVIRKESFLRSFLIVFFSFISFLIVLAGLSPLACGLLGLSRNRFVFQWLCNLDKG